MVEPDKIDQVTKTVEKGRWPGEDIIAEYCASTHPFEYAIAIAHRNHPEDARTTLDCARLLQQTMLGPNPTALERLLVDRVVTCWWRMQESETAYSHVAVLAGTDILGLFHKRNERAQRMYLEAIVALARVRKMALLDIQIQNNGQLNFAQQQVNVTEVKDVQA